MKKYFLFFAFLATAMLSTSPSYAAGEITPGGNEQIIACSIHNNSRENCEAVSYCRWTYAQTNLFPDEGEGGTSNPSLDFVGYCENIPCNVWGCYYCTDENVCGMCNNGFLLINGECQQANLVCLECQIENCENCTSDCSRCTVCRAGYHLSVDRRSCLIGESTSTGTPNITALVKNTDRCTEQ